MLWNRLVCFVLNLFSGEGVSCSASFQSSHEPLTYTWSPECGHVMKVSTAVLLKSVPSSPETIDFEGETSSSSVCVDFSFRGVFCSSSEERESSEC